MRGIDNRGALRRIPPSERRRRALRIDGFLSYSPQLVVQGTLLYAVEEHERGEPEQPLQEVAKRLTLVQALEIEVLPHTENRANHVRTAAERGTSGVDLVERRLPEDLERAVRLRIVGGSYELSAPPQTAEDMAGEVSAEDTVPRRLGITPERHIRENDEGKERPDVPRSSLGGHHSHLGMQQSGELKVEFGVACAVGAVGETRALGKVDDPCAQLAEPGGGDPVPTGGHVHGRLVGEADTTGQFGDREVSVLLEERFGLFREQSGVKEAHHDPSKILTAACRSEANREGDCRWRRRTSVTS